MKNVTVNQWVDLFKSIGLSKEDMNKWHATFEERHPQGHQSFLEWLGLEPSRIEKIRKGID